MKRWPPTLFVLLFSQSIFAVSNTPSSALRLHQAEVAVRVQLISKDSDCDKYCWYKVRILKILKGKLDVQPGSTITVAALSSDSGVPTGKCTLYLEAYNPQQPGRWKLLSGTATKGVSK